MIEWKAVREAASRFLRKHTAAAGWEHWNLSHVEQEGVLPLPKDRGADEEMSMALWSAALLWDWCGCPAVVRQLSMDRCR